VTYGEIAGQLREQMIWLLERQRIQQRIGGAGHFMVPVTTTEAERASLGAEIRSYRDAVLTYCAEAVSAARPVPNPVAQWVHDPIEGMRHWLHEARARSTSGRPLTDLMERRPDFEYVEKWQDAARSAVQGERELAALRRSALPPAHTGVLLKDAADLVRGVVVLDARLAATPGWQKLHQPSRLAHAAEAVSAGLSLTELDHSIDQYGWRPAPGVVKGPALPGLTGVLQAQHNALAHLGQFPSAYHLRHLLVAQADLSQQVARFARSVEFPSAAAFEERASLHRDLVTASRVVGGEIGDGRFAALESANAARRMRAVTSPGADVKPALSHLAHLGDRVDVRVSAAVEHGFREKLYFVAISLPVPGQVDRAGIVRPARKYIPVDSPVQSDLLALARQRLRPVPPVITPPDRRSDAADRVAFSSAVTMERTPRASR
jgi:hypothetical protein